MIVNNIWIFGIALAAGALGALVVALFGRQWSLLDRPNERSSHRLITPRGGGVGILAAFVFCAAFLHVPLYFLLPVILVALISLWEDRFGIGVFVRLTIQILAAGFFLVFLVVDSPVTLFDFLRLSPLFAFYLIFIVGTANFYNFMDGIDGIAGITGVAAFGLLGAYGMASGKEPAGVSLCFALALACIGFLPFNFPHARVFLGDVGSILLGFVFAGMVTVWSASPTEFLVLTGFLSLFYSDELVTLFERIRDGESPLKAHRRHLYQVLANEGRWPHWRIAAGYGLVQLLFGLTVWQAGNHGLPAVIGIWIVFFVLFGLINHRIKRRYQSGV